MATSMDTRPDAPEAAAPSLPAVGQETVKLMHGQLEKLPDGKAFVLAVTLEPDGEEYWGRAYAAALLTSPQVLTALSKTKEEVEKIMAEGFQAVEVTKDVPSDRGTIFKVGMMEISNKSLANAAIAGMHKVRLACRRRRCDPRERPCACSVHSGSAQRREWFGQ